MLGWVCVHRRLDVVAALYGQAKSFRGLLEGLAGSLGRKQRIQLLLRLVSRSLRLGKLLSGLLKIGQEPGAVNGRRVKVGPHSSRHCQRARDRNDRSRRGGPRGL
jgi:hypothetical protein